jgi:hypothetical protein
VGSRIEPDSSEELTPPRRTVWDWLGTVLFAVLGVPPVFLCLTMLTALFSPGPIVERLVFVFLGVGFLGVPGGLLCWRAWVIFTGRKARWRQSMRVRRRLCIRCGYDLRGGVQVCPECGLPVPESIDRIAARLEMMTGGSAGPEGGEAEKEDLGL